MYTFAKPCYISIVYIFSKLEIENSLWVKGFPKDDNSSTGIQENLKQQNNKKFSFDGTAFGSVPIICLVINK